MNHLYKRGLLFGIVTIVSLSALAQGKAGKAAKSDLALTIKAGGSFNNFGLSGENSLNYSSKSLNSFYVGATVDLDFGKAFSAQTGLSLVGKGSTISLPFTDAFIDTKYTPLYLQLPFNLIVKSELGPGNIFLGAGPYVGMGIAGKLKRVTVNYPPGTNTVERNGSIQFGSSSDKDLKTIDFGFNFLGGYRFDWGLDIHAGYGLGLTNINPDASQPKLSSRSFFIGLGYSFEL